MFFYKHLSNKNAQDFAMSEILLVLVLHLKTNKTLNDMAKIQPQIRNRPHKMTQRSKR